MVNVSISEVRKSLHLLASYPSAVAWSDLGDRGTPWYDPYHFESRDEEMKEALTLAAIRFAMPKYSVLHIQLGRAVAREVGNQYVHYDWLLKACARLLSGLSYTELAHAAKLAVTVQARMRACNLSS